MMDYVLAFPGSLRAHVWQAPAAKHQQQQFSQKMEDYSPDKAKMGREGEISPRRQELEAQENSEQEEATATKVVEMQRLKTNRRRGGLQNLSRRQKTIQNHELSLEGLIILITEWKPRSQEKKKKDISLHKCYDFTHLKQKSSIVSLL